MKLKTAFAWMFLVAAVFVSVCLVTITGCDTPGPMDRKVKESSYLPAEAKNVRHMGNRYAYFELEVGGKTRKFMFREGGQDNLLVELKD